MVRGGSARYVLVIGVERLSDITDLDDRGTAFIFADGAGAAVVGPSDDPGHRPGRVGLRRRAVRPDPAAGGLARRHRRCEQPVMPHLVMQGNPVFRWASFAMAKIGPGGARPRRHHRSTTSTSSCPHQANMRIIDAMARSMKLPERVEIARDIAEQGNTSAASIPLALDRMIAEGEAKQRRHRAADRLRRRPGVRRPGRHRPLTAPPDRPAHDTHHNRERTASMATTEEIRADLAEIVNEVAGIPADDVQLDKSFVDDLDVDSLSMVEVVVAAEEKFGVSIPDDEVKNLKTVGDAVAFIENAQG